MFFLHYFKRNFSRDGAIRPRKNVLSIRVGLSVKDEQTENIITGARKLITCTIYQGDSVAHNSRTVQSKKGQKSIIRKQRIILRSEPGHGELQERLSNEENKNTKTVYLGHWIARIV